MNHLLSVTTFTIGLSLSASAIAQSPPAGLPAIPVRTGSVQVPLPGSPVAHLPIVTQSSRIRAFNVAPKVKFIVSTFRMAVSSMSCLASADSSAL